MALPTTMADRLSKLEKAYRRHPDSPLFARLADLYLRRGKVFRALSICEKGCARLPDYATGFLVLSKCYEAQGNLEEARSAMDQALRLDPENPGGFKRLSHIYQGLGNPTLALKSLQEAAHLDPLDEDLDLQVEKLESEIGARADAEAEEESGENLPPLATQAESTWATVVEDDAPESEAEEPFGLLQTLPEWEEERTESETGTEEEIEVVERREEVPEESLSAFDLEEAARQFETPREPEEEDAPAALYIEEEDELATPAEETEADEGVEDELLKFEEEEIDAALDLEEEVEAAPEALEEEEIDAALDLEEEDAETGLGALEEAAGQMQTAAEQFPVAEEEPPFAEWLKEAAAGTESGLEPEEAPTTPFDNSAQEVEEAPIPFDESALEEVAAAIEHRYPPADDDIESLGADALETGEAQAAETSQESDTEEPLASARPPAPASARNNSPVSGLGPRDDQELLRLFQEIENQQRQQLDTGAAAQVAPAQVAAPAPSEEKDRQIATVTLAEIYAIQGLTQRAIETYRQILQQDPGNEEIRRKLTELEGNAKHK